MEESDLFYRSLCSTETLRSGKTGFFHDFSENVMQTVGDLWTSRIFGKIQSDEERIKTLFTDDKVKHVVVEVLKKISPIFRDKDAKISRCRRLEAYELAAAGQYEKALIVFSQAVLRAPVAGVCNNVDQGFSLSLAYIGRADVFISLKEYENALEDLKTAVDKNLPDDVKQEIQMKSEVCQQFLNETKKCIVPMLTASDKSGKEVNSKKANPEKTTCSFVDVSKGRNLNIPHASILLDIEDSPTAGKQAIASAEIDPGDVLVVEPPLASCILPEFYGTHCHHCFSRLRAPVGCPKCSSVAFCSHKCKDIALSSYHKFECKILALLIGSGMSILSSLAFRMITQEGFQRCMDIYNALKSSSSPKDDFTGTTADSKLSKSARRRLRKKKLQEAKNPNLRNDLRTGEIHIRAYDLVMHEKQRSAKDFLERTLMAAFLLKCLHRVNFFEQRLADNEPVMPEEIAIGSLLLKNLQLLQFNAHEVFETRLGNEHRFRGSKTVYIGVAIYPTVARFNHDCYPAVTRYFVDRNIVIRATRCLKPGEVIAENYGPIFTKRSLSERRRTLEGRYWFRCTCKACQEDWPLFQKMTNDSVCLRCPTQGCAALHSRPSNSNKSIKCPSCRKKIDLQDLMTRLQECEDIYAEGLANMEDEMPEKAIEKFIKGMKIFQKIAAPPHKETHLAEIALGACMADSGKTWKPQVL